MLTKNGGTLLALLIISAIACGSVYAQQKVYKWVDEDGVVHYGEEPPGESPEVEVDVFITDPAPAYVPPVQSTIQSPSTSKTDVEKQPKQQEIQTRPPVKQIDIMDMSLAELDRRCEAARQEKIAPLKAAEITNCVQAGTGDQDWCETFWADYGAPRRLESGGLTPPMFHDLPECVEAFEENNRRGLNPGD
jgi:hypothetical protein